MANRSQFQVFIQHVAFRAAASVTTIRMSDDSTESGRAEASAPPSDHESNESPYMVLPDSQTSEMRLVIQGSDDTRVVTSGTATHTIKLQGQDANSQCCLLL
jgi:hypothetical protein